MPRQYLKICCEIAGGIDGLVTNWKYIACVNLHWPDYGGEAVDTNCEVVLPDSGPHRHATEDAAWYARARALAGQDMCHRTRADPTP
ncbi:MAG: hypothetical protein NVS4B2_25790 [Chloroflexota bacterium]